MSIIKTPSLLFLHREIYTGHTSGMAYVVNSQKKPSNVSFYTSCIVNTEDNSVKLSYHIDAFKGMTDEFCGKYNTYSEAVNKYNELATQWDGHREL